MKNLLIVATICVVSSCNNSNNNAGAPGKDSNLTAAVSKANTDKPGCTSAFWFKKGAVLEYDLLNESRKVIMHTVTTIENVRKEGDALLADYTTSFPEGKKITAQYRCEGDKLYMNLKSLMGANLYKREGMEMEVSDAYISFPWNMKVGDDLEPTTFEIKMKQDGKDYITVRSDIKERKVLAAEKVVTAAGSFNCLKLTETRITTTIMMGKEISKRSEKSITWFNPEAGLVKSESMDAAGTLTGASELASIK